MHGAEATTEHSEVLAEHKDKATVDVAVARDHAIASELVVADKKKERKKKRKREREREKGREGRGKGKDGAQTKLDRQERRERQANNLLLVHAKIAAVVFYKHIVFLESARVQEQPQPFTCCELSLMKCVDTK